MEAMVEVAMVMEAMVEVTMAEATVEMTSLAALGLTEYGYG